jgi:structural maintenance of chromosome 1
LSHFDSVAAGVNEVYTRLTGSMGGYASLQCIDREQPYADGLENLIYDFKPPNKQFENDISSRSGGEKTIAGLALIFALATEKCPPMILLDEVDAHLDQDNVDRLSQYIKAWQAKPSAPQILMISHKESAVSQCQSLIGVTNQEYLLPPNHMGAINDDQDLEQHAQQNDNKYKFLTAATYSLDLRSYK